jgi:PcfJ-like protein
MDERLKNYVSGIYVQEGSYWRANRKAMCSCGHSFTTQIASPACPECGNASFARRNVLPTQRTTLEPLIEVIDKGDKHFHARRTEVKARIEDGKFVEFTLGKSLEIKFDLIKKEFLVLNEKGEQLETDENNYKAFFKGLSHRPTQFINQVSTEKNRELFLYAYNHLAKRYGERSTVLYRGFTRLLNIGTYFEILYFMGFDIMTIHYNKDAFRWQETKPHKIINVPKYAVPYLLKMNSLGSYKLSTLRKLDESFGGNNVKTILQILDEESSLHDIESLRDRFIELYTDYGYKDVKKLTLYVCREVKLQQGIVNPDTAIQYLRDYARMSKELDLEWEKYPKSLKKEHDIMTLTYRVKHDNAKKESFVEVVKSEDYQKLTYKTKTYSVIAPDEPNDLIKEGKTLSHCIASYVNDVVNKRCKIYFARPTQALDQSMLSIEVRDNKFIRQVKGKQNRIPSPDEKEFIEKWASKVGLEVANY